MAEDFPVRADLLKRLIKQSLRMPIPFGFNPGGADEGDEYLAAHPRKPPELMGRIAMYEGEGTKSAFGTFAISDTELHLTCFRLVPNLARRFKRFLKANRIVLNVVVMDETGDVVDSDIEDLVEAFDVAAQAEEGEEPAATVPQPAPQPATAAAAAAARPRSIDPAVAAAAALSDRLKRLQPQVLAAPAPVAAKLGTLFRSAVAMVREGRLKEGGAAVAALEATFAKIGRAPAGAAAQAPVSAAAPRDPRLPKLREALMGLEDRAVRLLGEDGAEAVLGDLEPLAAQIDLGEGDAVRAALVAAQERVADLARARARWEGIAPRLGAKVEAALAAGAPAALRQRWRFAAGLAAVGDWPRALAAVPGLVAQLRDAALGAGADPARARALWRAALARAQGRDRPALAAAGVELEAVLAALEGGADPAGRRALQDRGRAIVAGVRAALAA